ncbi:MAG TPA: nucleotide exchange factor GrpE [Acidimicrobiia bacterium]|nr:nucleotide exchange factor GrpE [Acidimicrobiia bacterium]
MSNNEQEAAERWPVEAEIIEIHDLEPIDPAALGLILPDDPAEREQMLLGAIVQAQADASSLLDDLQRLAAEFDNYRKRTQRDMTLSIERASERVIERLLPVLDTFDAALLIEATSPTEHQLLGGMLGTREQLLEVLKAEGLDVIPAAGETFNPEIHEAVVASGDGTESIVVSSEMRKGYTLKGKVIRAALVAVNHE